MMWFWSSLLLISWQVIKFSSIHPFSRPSVYLPSIRCIFADTLFCIFKIKKKKIQPQAAYHIFVLLEVERRNNNFFYMHAGLTFSRCILKGFDVANPNKQVFQASLLLHEADRFTFADEGGRVQEQLYIQTSKRLLNYALCVKMTQYRTFKLPGCCTNKQMFWMIKESSNTYFRWAFSWRTS